MARLILENLGKTYPGGVRALRDFSLEAGEGELVSIVGPSGCGKSTLLRLIAGLEEETTGTVRLDDRVLNGRAPKDRDMALVFQSYTLLPHLTVAENLAFGLKLRGEPAAARAEKARVAAALLGIEHLLDRLPAEISGGERQRTALGRAVLRSPGAFLFDEPLSSLDAQMRLQLRVEIQRLHRRVRAPMLFVTHDQSEALTLGDRVAVLDQGVLQQIATPEDLYLRPANAFTASFIGNPGMNLFSGRIEEGRFVSPILAFALPAEKAARLGSRDVLAGVRPEHLRMDAEGPLRGEVTAVERQGGQATLYVQNGTASFAVRTAGDFSARVGDAARWAFDPAQAFFFDAPTGAALP